MKTNIHVSFEFYTCSLRLTFSCFDRFVLFSLLIVNLLRVKGVLGHTQLNESYISTPDPFL